MLAQLFNYEGQPIRTEVRDGMPWFIKKDICDIFEIVNNRDAYFKLDQDEKGVVFTDTLAPTEALLQLVQLQAKHSLGCT